MPEPDDDAPNTADESLLAAVGDALGVDPLPDGLADRARALFAFADVDAELTLLLEESAPTEAGVRGGATTAPLVYSSAEGHVTVEIECVDGSLSGLLLGVTATTVTLELTDGRTVEVPVGALGRFGVTTSLRGAARLCVASDSGTVCTEWFVI